MTIWQICQSKRRILKLYSKWYRTKLINCMNHLCLIMLRKRSNNSAVNATLWLELKFKIIKIYLMPNVTILTRLEHHYLKKNSGLWLKILLQTKTNRKLLALMNWKTTFLLQISCTSSKYQTLSNPLTWGKNLMAAHLIKHFS